MFNFLKKKEKAITEKIEVIAYIAPSEAGKLKEFFDRTQAIEKTLVNLIKIRTELLREQKDYFVYLQGKYGEFPDEFSLNHKEGVISTKVMA